MRQVLCLWAKATAELGSPVLTLFPVWDWELLQLPSGKDEGGAAREASKFSQLLGCAETAEKLQLHTAQNWRRLNIPWFWHSASFTCENRSPAARLGQAGPAARRGVTALVSALDGAWCLFGH